jgi:branched-chain amino acid transport system substrate-binding protein
VRSTRPALAVGIAAALLLAACGGDDDDTAATTAPAAEATTAATTAASSASSEPAATTGGSTDATTAGSAAAPTGGTLTLNAIEMLSGSGALYGKAVEEGLQLAADTVNAQGGVMGMKLEVAVADNASDDAQTSTLVKKYADDSDVGIIIPPTYQPNFNAACSAATAAGLPIVSAQSGPPDPAGNTKALCYTMTTDPVPQVTFTLKALQAKGLKSFAMVYDQDNGYVAFQRPNIEAAAEALGIEIKEIGVPGGTTDFGPQITELIDAAPDTTFAIFTIEDASRFMKQAKDNGYEGGWFDPVSQLTSRRIPDLSDGAASGLLASTPQSADDVASFKAFLAAYKAKNGKDLDDPTYTGFGYDAVMLAVQAMTDAGTTTDRAKIQAAIAATTDACFSICFTQAPTGGATAGAFLANDFYLVELTDDGFVAAG